MGLIQPCTSANTAEALKRFGSVCQRRPGVATYASGLATQKRLS